MTDVTDYGFELSGVPFGIGQDVTVENEGFDPGADEWLVQDIDNPKNGVTQMGRERLQGPTWLWQLSTDMEDDVTALAALGRLKTAWRAASIRDKPGELVRLRYRIGNRTRCVFGRPRRFAHPPSNRILNGYIPITADFKCVDGLQYDDVQDSVVITIVAEATGGFRLPARLPLTSLPSTLREGVINVGGDALTYPIIRIDGPVTNPWVAGLDWRLDLSTALTAGQYLEIDTRPWKNTVLRNGVANLSDAVGRRQWLSLVRLTPGTQEITFGGQSASGTATATVSWRSAWNSL